MTLPTADDLAFPGALRAAVLSHMVLMRPLVSDDPDGFVTRVLRTRNYLLHRDPVLEKGAAAGQALYWLIEKLKLLTKARLLEELGFPKDRVRELLEHNRNYRHLKSV